jgi:lysyl-tRNA synthetase class 2
MDMYLRIAPELYLKRLTVGGFERVYEINRNFRNEGVSTRHNPEFTMLEWYRANAPYQALMDDCAALLAETARAADTKVFEFRGKVADPFAAPERIAVAEAFTRHAQIDLLATVRGENGDRDALAAAALKSGVQVASDDTWTDIFSRVLAEKIEPHLGLGCATIFYEYPLPLAALARPKQGSDKVAERFELYVCGVELANAFGELTDVAEQRRRFDAAMQEKQRIHGESYPVDEDFLAALANMPLSSGIALGFDRLVMLATGAHRVDRVMWTPVVEP